MLKSLSLLQIKAIAAKPEKLSGIEKWVSFMLENEGSTQTQHSTFQPIGYPVWDMYGYNSSDLKPVVFFWCSGAH